MQVRKYIRSRTGDIMGALFLVLFLAVPLTASADDGRSAQSDHVIDVLVVYPQPAGDQMEKITQWGRNWGETEIGPFLDAVFDRIGMIYQDSGVSVSFAVVHHEEIDYSQFDTDWQVVLSLALMNSENGLASHAPYLEAIEGIRATYGADIVVYWREFGDGGPSSNGAGSIGGGPDEAYLHLTYGGMNPMIGAHETGHLFGAEHSDGIQASATYSLNGDSPLLLEYRTVMTIAVPLGLPDRKYLWRFSDRNATTNGATNCGELSGVLESCNFIEETPLGNEDSHVVDTLTAMAPVIAAFSEAANPEAVCGNEIVEIGEDCDEASANGTGRSCCTSECQFKPNGPSSCDGTLCTTRDICTDGICSAGHCRIGEVCSFCGGICEIADETCGCAF